MRASRLHNRDSFSHLPARAIKDIERIVHCTKNRGIGFFTHDLPELDDLLLEGLKSGRFPHERLKKFCLARGSLLPAFMLGVWARVFDSTSGTLLPYPCTTAIHLLRTVACIGKKVEIECASKYQRKTLNDYVAIDRSLRQPSKFWQDPVAFQPVGSNARRVCFSDGLDVDLPLLSGAEDSRPSADKQRRAILRANFQKFCDGFLQGIPVYSPGKFFEEERSRGKLGVRHGPGAVASGNKYVDKFDFRYWNSTLSSVFNTDHFAWKASFEDQSFVNNVVPSRVILVHKDAKKMRVIAAEPIENMWCQQLTLSFFKRHVFGKPVLNQVTMHDQRPSRRMAMEGSKDGSLCTIDLSSASDRLSLWVVERVFRNHPSLLYALRAHRTPYSILPNGEYLHLKKFASQGSAVTFPLQCLVFWLVVQSIACDGDIRRLGKTARSRYVRVFGDDIICKTEMYSSVALLLKDLELVINEDKSFFTGFFRESCGGDYYKGDDVTPFRIRKPLDGQSPSSLQSLIDYTNNAFEAGLWKLSEALRRLLPTRVRDNLPIHQVIDDLGAQEYAENLVRTGLVSFTGDRVDHLRHRWNPDYQVIERRYWSILSKDLTRPRTGTSKLRKAVYELHSRPEHYSSDISLRPNTRERLGWGNLGS